jgi:hypothetical protein
VPKFNCEAEFSLETEIEYDSYGNLPYDESIGSDHADNSYFGSENVTLNGGSVTFTVEADDDADAYRVAADVVADGMEVEDRNGLTWAVTDVSITVERDEMTRDEAFVIVRRLLDRLVAESHITSEEREALDLVIQDS